MLWRLSFVSLTYYFPSVDQDTLTLQTVGERAIIVVRKVIMLSVAHQLNGRNHALSVEVWSTMQGVA